MCLILYAKGDNGFKTKPKPKTAKRDITVYKVLVPWNKTLVSPVQEMRYRKGWHYTEEITTDDFEPEDDMLVINAGLYSYGSLQTAERNFFSHGRIVEMTIPKGAQYYTDGIQIVSTELIWYPDAKVHKI